MNHILSLYKFVTKLLLFVFCFFFFFFFLARGHVPGIEPISPELEGKVPTTGPQGKSQY